MRKIGYDNYLITINPSFEIGVDYSIIDVINDVVIVGNATYCDYSSDLKEFFDYIYNIIEDYVNRKEKEENV